MKLCVGTNYILGYIASPSAMDLTTLYRKFTLFSAPITPAGILLTPLYRNLCSHHICWDPAENACRCGRCSSGTGYCGHGLADVASGRRHRLADVDFNVF